LNIPAGFIVIFPEMTGFADKQDIIFSFFKWAFHHIRQSPEILIFHYVSMHKLEGVLMRLIKYIILISAAVLAGCSSLRLMPSDFSWPVESVIHVDNNGMAKEDRYAISFNAKPLYFTETGDSLAYLDRELRMIRDTLGYYYITGDKFKNVYVFTMGDGAFNIYNEISISDSGISKPVFNQRPPYIELVEGNKQYYLSNNGIENKEKK